MSLFTGGSNLSHVIALPSRGAVVGQPEYLMSMSQGSSNGDIMSLRDTYTVLNAETTETPEYVANALGHVTKCLQHTHTYIHNNINVYT